MPLRFHPRQGTVVVCDFGDGFRPPEMVKRRPAIVISPQIADRPGLCTVVPISTRVPHVVMPFHVELADLTLPHPYAEGPNWVKADMVFAASLERLDLFRAGRGRDGKRLYLTEALTREQFAQVRRAVLCGLGMSFLTKHLE